MNSEICWFRFQKGYYKTPKVPVIQKTTFFKKVHNNSSMFSFACVRNMFRQLVKMRNQLWPYKKGKVNPLFKKKREGLVTINNLKYSTNEICFLVMHNRIMSSHLVKHGLRNHCYLVYYHLKMDT